ncbi:MAG: hypothetical protein M3Y91_17150 [Actinomycetota bacterium]|nr:hypothetical protein [Actinomycetota bacterium]
MDSSLESTTSPTPQITNPGGLSLISGGPQGLNYLFAGSVSGSDNPRGMFYVSALTVHNPEPVSGSGTHIPVGVGPAKTPYCALSLSGCP